jgi:hypothetical protein
MGECTTSDLIVVGGASLMYYFEEGSPAAHLCQSGASLQPAVIAAACSDATNKVVHRSMHHFRDLTAAEGA